MQFTIGGVTLSRAYAFTLAGSFITIEQVVYPDGPGGLDPPQLAGQPSHLQCVFSEVYPPEVPITDDILLWATNSHCAVALRVSDNTASSASAPAQIDVVLVSFDQDGAEIDRLPVTLTALAGDDGDSTHIVYTNDLSIPLVLIDQQLNRADFSAVKPIFVAASGEVAVFPQ